MAKWNLDGPAEMIAVPVDARIYKQLVADLAEIFYRHFRQPDSKTTFSAPSIETTVTALNTDEGINHD